MEENFNMRKIHTGYVVEFRNGQRAMAMRYDNGNAGPNILFTTWGRKRCFGRIQDWDPATMRRMSHSPDAECVQDLDIVRVYGYVRAGHAVALVLDASPVSCAARNVLWERKEAVKMTLAQVCEKLGYDVEIVKEAQDNAE